MKVARLADAQAGNQQEPIAPRLVGRVTGPVLIAQSIARAWDLSHADMAILLAYESTSELRDLFRGVLTLRGRDREDRLRHLFRIHETLLQLFRDEAMERAWLNQPMPELDNISSLSHMREGSMEHLLFVRYYVERMAGR